MEPSKRRWGRGIVARHATGMRGGGGAVMGWVRGFEPPLSRATTWRLRPLGDTHRERTRPTGRAYRV